MEAQVSIKSGESYRISGSFNNKGLAQNLKVLGQFFAKKYERL